MKPADAKQIFKRVAMRLGYETSTPAALRALYCEAMALPDPPPPPDEADWIVASILLAYLIGPCKTFEATLDVPKTQTGPRGPGH